MRYLFVFRLYSGLAPSLRTGRWQPFGLPDVYRLLEGVSARGVPSTVVFLGREELAHDEFPLATTVRFPELTTEFHIIPAFRLPRWLPASRVIARLARFYSDARQFWAVFRRFCRKGDVSLVYVDRRNVVFAALMALLKFPTVVRFHGINNWNRFPAMWRLVIRQPLICAALRAPFSLVLSSEDGSPARQFFDRALSRRTPYRVVVNGVDPMPETASAVGLRERFGFHNDDWPILLFVSRLSADKGISQLVSALTEANERLQNFYLVIIAGGSDTTEMMRTLDELGFAGRAAVLQSVAHKDIHNYYAECDVFISTNLIANLTNTVLEAMSAGMCVVLLGKDPVTFADASTERLLPDDVVVRIPRDSVERRLAEKLVWLIGEPARIRAYKDATVAFARSFLWPWDERIAFELDLLEDIAMPANASSRRCPKQQTAMRATHH